MTRPTPDTPESGQDPAAPPPVPPARRRRRDRLAYGVQYVLGAVAILAGVGLVTATVVYGITPGILGDGTRSPLHTPGATPPATAPVPGTIHLTPGTPTPRPTPAATAGRTGPRLLALVAGPDTAGSCQEDPITPAGALWACWHEAPAGQPAGAGPLQLEVYPTRTAAGHRVQQIGITTGGGPTAAGWATAIPLPPAAGPGAVVVRTPGTAPLSAHQEHLTAVRGALPDLGPGQAPDGAPEAAQTTRTAR